MRPLALLALSLGLAACSGSRVPADPSVAPAGIYDTTFGRLALTAPRADGAVEGLYALDDGRVAGTYADGVFVGEWVETGTSGECPPDEFGQTFYGPFTFHFSEDRSSFEGTWGRCDGGEEAEAWSGQYRGPLPGGALYFDATPGVPAMAVPPGAAPPAGVYLTGAGEITILPPDDQGRFLGRFDGIGRVEMLVGTVEGRVLSGTWVDPTADGACAPSDQGWTDYGLFRFELRDAGVTSTLRGTRGTCDGPLTESWSGLRQ